jgi:thymidylate synthase
MVIEVEEPMGEPRYHRMPLALPKDIKTYISEVIDGIHDDWIDLSNPTKWHYTYHERLTDYTFMDCYDVADGEGLRAIENSINQLDALFIKLKKHPTSRRAQAITYKPWQDDHEKDPPCLQRIWCQVVDGKLDMHTHWRSREAILASYMNILAFAELQMRLAAALGVGIGWYTDFSDSFHIYERNFPQAQNMVSSIKRRPWSSRYLTSSEFNDLL